MLKVGLGILLMWDSALYLGGVYNFLIVETDAVSNVLSIEDYLKIYCSVECVFIFLT